MRKFLLTLCLLSSSFALGLERQANADYRARREALAKKLDGGIALIFAAVEADGPNAIYGFRQSDNFYYLTGVTEPGAAVLIVSAAEAKDDKPARSDTEILFLPNRDLIQEKWTGPKLGADTSGVQQSTGFVQVWPLSKLDEELPHFLSRGDRLYTELPDPSNGASPTVLDWLRRTNALPGRVAVEDARPLLASLRTFKDAGEVALIRKATDASAAAHRAAMRAMKAGMNEREISAVLQYEWDKRGCERPAYSPIVGSGFNSTVLHYSADSAPIEAGEVIVIDAAGEYSMYASDITRTLPAAGKFTPRQREIYDIVLGAQQAAIDAFQAGRSTIRRDRSANSLYQVAYDYINTHGKDLHGEPLGKYFIHGLSHWVGLNVHDEGDNSLPLNPGMVFTIEPGIYIPEEKLGVRIEDMFYVDANGKLVRLSEGLPRTADEVEQAMAGK
jgi:Xaa-Pro aminopeptidase